MKLKIPTLPGRSAPPPSTDVERIQRLRDWIDAADRDGSSKDDLVLKLTHRDGATLKRHRSVSAQEITFGPCMRFLGVRVVEGAPATVLELDPTPSA